MTDGLLNGTGVEIWKYNLEKILDGPNGTTGDPDTKADGCTEKGSGYKSAIFTFNLKRIDLFLVAFTGPKDCGLRSEMWRAWNQSENDNPLRKRGEVSNNEGLLAAVDVWRMQKVHLNTVNSATKYT